MASASHGGSRAPIPLADAQGVGPVPLLLHGHCASWASAFCEALDKLSAGNPQVVRVSCSGSHTFSGEPSLEQHVLLELGKFARRAAHAKPVADLHLYLSQLRLDSELPDLAAHLPPENPFLGTLSHDSPPRAYLWWSAGPTLSAAHQDSEDNVLCVLRGSKTIALAPPVSLLRSAPPLTQGGAHHSSCRFFSDASEDGDGLSPEWWLPQRCLPEELRGAAEEPVSGGASHGLVARPLCGWMASRMPTSEDTTVPVQYVTLRAGDAVFLPEGWWHSVVSAPGTTAVNFWARRRSVVAAQRPFEALHWARTALQSEAHRVVASQIEAQASKARAWLQGWRRGPGEQSEPGEPCRTALLDAIVALSAGKQCEILPSPHVALIAACIADAVRASIDAGTSRASKDEAVTVTNSVFALLAGGTSIAVLEALLPLFTDMPRTRSADAHSSLPSSAEVAGSKRTRCANTGSICYGDFDLSTMMSPIDAALPPLRTLLESLSPLTVASLARRWESLQEGPGGSDIVSLQPFFAKLWSLSFGPPVAAEQHDEDAVAESAQFAHALGTSWLRRQEEQALQEALVSVLRDVTGLPLAVIRALPGRALLSTEESLQIP